MPWKIFIVLFLKTFQPWKTFILLFTKNFQALGNAQPGVAVASPAVFYTLPGHSIFKRT